MGRPEARERARRNRERLGRLERSHGGRAARVGVEHGEQAEDLAGRVHGERRDVAERRRDARREAARSHAVQAVAGIALVEDDLAAAERPAPARVAELQLGHVREHIDGHGVTLHASVTTITLAACA